MLRAGLLVSLLLLPLLASADQDAELLNRFQSGDLSVIKTWQQQAKEGNAKAQLYLAYLYRTGKGGLKKDPQASIRLYRLAAENGDPNAQFELALMNELGDGVEQDIGEAEFWYNKATSHDLCPGELSPGGELSLN